MADKCIIIKNTKRQVRTVKKIYTILVVTATVFILSFCVSAIHTVDGGVYIEDVQTGADGTVPEKEEKTLGRVENLKFVKSSRGTVTLSWDKVEGAYGYKVFIKYEGDEKFRYTYTLKNNEVTVEDIENEGGLVFKVRAFCYDAGKVIYGKYSKTVNAVTKPENVTEIYTRNITDDSITLYWNKAKGATGYRVYIYSKKDEKFKLYKRTSRTTMTVSGLKKDTRYIFKVMSYKRINNSTALGDYSAEYKEFTYNSGAVPRSMAQAAQFYNEHIALLKAETDMTVKLNKTIDTEFISCSKNNLSTSVKNTLSLFEGNLKKTYKYVGGHNESKSANKLIEPCGKKAALERNDIKEYSVSSKDGKITLRITLKDENSIYNKGDKKQKSYFDGVLALPEFTKLKTTPLVIEGADSYYDGGEITMTVKNGRVSALNIRAAMLADIDFSVSDVVAGTVVGYELTEKFSITYSDKAR